LWIATQHFYECSCGCSFDKFRILNPAAHKECKLDKHDVDVNLAQWFLEHRIDSPREGRLWLKYIPKKEIPNWKAAEFDPISASEWREIGFGPKTSLEWLAQGANSAKVAGEWLKYKFELKEETQWLARSISPENAKKWRDKGVGPDIAQRREQAGVRP
jgi:hypothetical protein